MEPNGRFVPTVYKCVLYSCWLLLYTFSYSNCHGYHTHNMYPPTHPYNTHPDLCTQVCRSSQISVHSHGFFPKVMENEQCDGCGQQGASIIGCGQQGASIIGCGQQGASIIGCGQQGASIIGCGQQGASVNGCGQ